MRRFIKWLTGLFRVRTTDTVNQAAACDFEDAGVGEDA